MEIYPNPSPSTSHLYPSLWRNNNPNHVTRDNTRYQDKVFYYSILDPSLSYQDKILAYHAAINNDFQTGLPNGTNPRVYADSQKKIYMIHLGMKICTEMNLNTTL